MHFEKIRSLDQLDPKKTIAFLSSPSISSANRYATPITLDDDNIIWTFHNFLMPEECDEIINSSENAGFESIQHLYDKNYRDNERILAFDQSKLFEIMQNRLKHDSFLERINLKKPYGFFTGSQEWLPNDGSLNPCLRINKYQPNSSGFGWHRDSSYTQSTACRSNYTIVIYLNNLDCTFCNPNCGTTSFCYGDLPKNVAGLTVKEEMELMENYKEISIKPKKGMAVIFDQRLLHKANSCCCLKYVLRTDMLCFAKPLHTLTFDEIQMKNMNLTQQLFRQAQYYELQGYNENAQKLYEICISMRVNSNIQKYQEHLSKYLTPIPAEVNIPTPNTFKIQSLCRTGREHVFKYHINENDENDERNNLKECVRLCSAFVLANWINSINSEYDKTELTKSLLQYSSNIHNITFEEENIEDRIQYCSKDMKNYILNYLPEEDKILIFAKQNENDSENDSENDFEKVEMREKEFRSKTKKKLGFNIFKGKKLCKREKEESIVYVDAKKNLYHVEETCVFHGRQCCVEDSDSIEYKYIYKSYSLKHNPCLSTFNVSFLKEYETYLKGTVEITYFKETLNHASCEFDTYVKKIEEDKEESFQVSTTMSFEINLLRNTISILYVPKIVV